MQFDDVAAGLSFVPVCRAEIGDADLAELVTLPADADGKEFDESCADDVKMTECPKCGEKFPI